jgi:hypothetical protein
MRPRVRPWPPGPALRANPPTGGLAEGADAGCGDAVPAPGVAAADGATAGAGVDGAGAVGGGATATAAPAHPGTRRRNAAI